MATTQTLQMDRALAIATARELIADGRAQRIREAARLSLHDAGRILGVPASTVRHWELGGRPRPLLAERYGEVLSVLRGRYPIDDEGPARDGADVKEGRDAGVPHPQV